MAGVRQARRDESRRRLVDAAAAAFVARGYAAVTLDEVATAAGLTKGAVYSNFSGKLELALAVLAELVDEPQLAIFDQVAAGADGAERLARATAILAASFDSGLFRLELEVTAEALRTAEGHTLLVARDATARAGLVAALARGHGARADPAALVHQANALIATVNGAALERLKAPEQIPDALIARLLDAVTEAFTPRTDGVAP
jgi:AcrR family transcriptional regulator